MQPGRSAASHRKPALAEMGFMLKTRLGKQRLHATLRAKAAAAHAWLHSQNPTWQVCATSAEMGFMLKTHFGKCEPQPP